jgi:hypothetical protein
MVRLSSSGEVGQFISVTQFDGGSTSKCGFYAVATVAGSAAVGGQPWPAIQIATSADQRYIQIDGPDVLSNQNQMDQPLCHTDLAKYALSGIDLNSPDSAPSWDAIKASVANGYPVIICVPEPQVFDIEAGGNPYPWNSTGLNHIILVTGIASDGNILVRDSANIESPNNIRPGPRHYRIDGLDPYWAIQVKPSWYSAQAAAQGGQTVGVPAGWHDDPNKKILTAPNGVQVTQGFRDYILTNEWNPEDIPLQAAQGLNPLELSNPSLGGGTQQITRESALEWTSKQGVFKAWIGQELIATKKFLSIVQGKLTDLQNAYNDVVTKKNDLVGINNSLKDQIATLTQQLNEKTDTSALEQQIAQLQSQNQALTNQVNSYKSKLSQIDAIAKAS